jgi:type II secretory pathway component HofQ
MRTLFLAALISAAVMAGAGSGGTAHAGLGEPAPQISLAVRDVPLSRVIEELSKTSGLTCSIDPSVPDVRISLNVQSNSPQGVLRLIVRQAGEQVLGLGLRKEGDAYVLRVRPLEEQGRERVLPGHSDARLGRKVTLDLQQVPLRQALERVLEGSGVQFVVEPGMPPISLDLKLAGRTAFQGLLALVETAAWQVPELQLTREKGIYHLEVATRRPPDPAARATLREAKVTIDLQAVPLREAVGKILAGSALQFLVHRNVPDVKVTLEVRSRTLEEALQALIRAVGEEVPGLTLGQDGDVFVLETRGPAAARRPNKWQL